MLGIWTLASCKLVVVQKILTLVKFSRKWKVCGAFLFRQSKKACSIIPWSVRIFFVFLEKKRPNKYCLWEENFQSVDI